MATGIVSRFDSKRGFGFIKPDDTPADAPEGAGDAFVHQKDIVMEGFRSLLAGERVEFDAEANEKGIKALNVRLLSPRTERPRVERAAVRSTPTRRGPATGPSQSQFECLLNILLRTEQLTPDEVDEIHSANRAMAHSDR